MVTENADLVRVRDKRELSPVKSSPDGKRRYRDGAIDQDPDLV